MSTAYWCVLVAALLPYFTVAIAKVYSPYNNAKPRSPDTYKGLALRAHSAHLNGFEVFPFFAIAVISASGASPVAIDPLLNSLALAWIVARLAYTGAYLLDQASARSLIWIVNLTISVAIFTMPAWRK